MKNLITKLSALILVALFGLNACSDDDDASATCENGSLEMTVNGEVVTATSFNNTLLKGNSAGSDGKRMDIRATDAEGRQLIITFTDLSTGLEGNGVSTDEYISSSDVVTGTENVFLFTIIENNVSEMFTQGSLDVTSSDGQRVSGTFSFSHGDLEVTNGSFTDMCYTVLQ